MPCILHVILPQAHISYSLRRQGPFATSPSMRAKRDLEKAALETESKALEA